MILPGESPAVGCMLALGHNLWPRFFFFCMGFALLIAVHGAMELWSIVAKLRVIPNGWTLRMGYALAGMMILSLRHHRAPLLRAAQTGFHRRQGICRNGNSAPATLWWWSASQHVLPDILRTFVARRANSGGTGF